MTVTEAHDPDDRLVSLFARCQADPTLDPAAVCGDDAVLLAKLRRALATAGRFVVSPTVADPPPPAVPGFELQEEVGRGGMGVVYRALDQALGRDVAVKLLGPRSPVGGTQAKRFRAEAAVTGRLQHPGIPAVYQMGTAGDGRPYLAMKLIRGETLAGLLKAGADRGQLVAVFEGVCQAVAYAHSMGVVHRDLKPANVMVGAFGEVQVMDWGLAKELVSREAESSEPSAETAHTPADITRDGAIIGTPAYMPPEQAVGDVAAMDRRSDVFGLGAVLCAVLTGWPPYRGADPLSTRELAAAGDLSDAFARLDKCGAEPGLVALAKRCLNTARAGRPADAGEVAAAVAELRQAADARARRAEVDRGRARVRRRLGGLAAAVLLAGVAGTGWQWRKTRQALADKTAEFDRAERNLADRDDARAATLRALRKLSDDVVEARLGTAAALSAADRQFLTDVAALWQAAADARDDSGDARAVRADGLYRLGRIRQKLGETAAAEADYRACLALDDALAADFPDRLVAPSQAAAVLSNLGQLLADADRPAEAEAAMREAIRRREALTAAHPDRTQDRQGLARTHGNLALLLRSAGRPAEAVAAARAAVAVHEQVADPDPDARYEVIAARVALGLALRATGAAGEAEGVYRRARADAERLAADCPHRPDFDRAAATLNTNLGVLLRAVGKPAEAEACYRAAVVTAGKLAAAHPARPEYRDLLGAAHNNLGTLLLDADRPADADAALTAALAVRERLAADFPGRPDYTAEVAGTCVNLAQAKRVVHRPADALPLLDRAITLLAADRRPGAARQTLRGAHVVRASTLDGLNRPAEAVADWDAALALVPGVAADLHARVQSLARAGMPGRAAAEVDALAGRAGWTGWQLYDFARVYARRPDRAGEAVRLLWRAADAGFTRVEQLDADPDLAAVRDRLDFRWLVTKLRAKRSALGS